MQMRVLYGVGRTTLVVYEHAWHCDESAVGEAK